MATLTRALVTSALDRLGALRPRDLTQDSKDVGPLRKLERRVTVATGRPHVERLCVNRGAAALLGVTAIGGIGIGIERIVYWVSLPLGPHFGAGETFGTVVGAVAIALGVGVGLTARAVWHDGKGGWIGAGVWAVALGALAYIALSTPGPAPVPVPLSIGAGVIGVVLGTLVVVRASGRPARW